MISKEELTLEEKVKLLSGQSGENVCNKYGSRYFRMSDGPHGIKKHGVCYPNMCLVSNSWDPDLLFEMGKSVGYDCNTEGIDVLLGPGVNLKRNPLCGRNFEYISEDPLLAGTLGAAWINGLQSTGAAACVKHFCCYNQETNRFTQRVYADDDTVMNVYVRVFRILLRKSSPRFLMTSYNNLNGKFVAQNEFLLKHVLREILKFKGVVISDWGGVDYRSESLKAGVDIYMPGDKDSSWRKVIKTIENGDLSEADINESLDRVLRALEETLAEKSAKPTDALFLKKLASESMVLLKNENNALPLSVDDDFVVIGSLAKNPCVQGGGCATVDNASVRSPYEELLVRAGRNIGFAAGYSDADDKVNADLEKEATEEAEKHDCILFFAGQPIFADSEGYDRSDLKLPSNQLSVLKKLRELNKKVIVVLTNGSSLELTEIADSADALLDCWYAGDVYAEACCDVLFGNVNPSGRLSESFPDKKEDYFPSDHYIDENDRVVYKECENVGYKYYNAKGIKARYPFGYGLSYTEFVYGKANITPLADGKGYLVDIDVRNTGKRTGKTVVQVYMRHESDKTHSLAGFAKTELLPDEEKTVKVVIDEECFSRYNPFTKNYFARNGRYDVFVGKNAEEITFVGSVCVENKFICNRYTTIRELLATGNGSELVKKYLAPYICKAALDKPDYPIRIENGKIIENDFVSKLAETFPLYIFTTLTSGMLNNDGLDALIGKINSELTV